MTTPLAVAGVRVVVAGAGRSGIAAAELLADRGAQVVLTDLAPVEDARRASLEARGVRVVAGPHDPELFASAGLVVLSPGVPPEQPAFDAARRAGVPVIGEVELAWRFLGGRTIAITGTKGKSTTTTLTARMLEQGGLPVTAGGNLGTALSGQVAASTPETLHVVEVSSFQLETTDTFRPWIAVLLNLSPDHLDRHASFEAYAGAKARIFANQQPDDWAVVNADDPAALALARGARARRMDFALDADLGEGITVEADRIVQRRNGRSQPLLPVSAVRLSGRHLLSDVLAATAVARIAGVGAEAIAQAVEGFTGLEHALETVTTIAGVRFVDDSKATNVVAARRAIESFERGVVVILGGRYKGGAFEDLRESLAARAAGVVLIGEAADRIERALDRVVPIARAGSMGEAVRRAHAMAPPGGVVVLAPGCSSFDMFADYAARGRAFKDEVRRLAADLAGHPVRS